MQLLSCSADIMKAIVANPPAFHDIHMVVVFSMGRFVKIITIVAKHCLRASVSGSFEKIDDHNILL